jgi:hypothetical protein
LLWLGRVRRHQSRAAFGRGRLDRKTHLQHRQRRGGGGASAVAVAVAIALGQRRPSSSRATSHQRPLRPGGPRRAEHVDHGRAAPKVVPVVVVGVVLHFLLVFFRVFFFEFFFSSFFFERELSRRAAPCDRRRRRSARFRASCKNNKDVVLQAWVGVVVSMRPRKEEREKGFVCCWKRGKGERRRPLRDEAAGPGARERAPRKRGRPESVVVGARRKLAKVRQLLRPRDAPSRRTLSLSPRAWPPDACRSARQGGGGARARTRECLSR